MAVIARFEGGRSGGRRRILGGLVLTGQQQSPAACLARAGVHVFQAAPGWLGQDQAEREAGH